LDEVTLFLKSNRNNWSGLWKKKKFNLTKYGTQNERFQTVKWTKVFIIILIKKKNIVSMMNGEYALARALNTALKTHINQNITL